VPKLVGFFIGILKFFSVFASGLGENRASASLAVVDFASATLGENKLSFIDLSCRFLGRPVAKPVSIRRHVMVKGMGL